MTDEQFVEWCFVTPDEQVRSRATVIRPGKVVRFRFDDATFILGLNSAKEVAINGEFWDLGPDVEGIIELMELFRDKAAR
ncbi:MAG: hypothetical protein ACT4OM_08470 [Actinomycetota bacterium]